MSDDAGRESDRPHDPYGDDVFTEPDGDVDTLSHLGPLAPLAGVWEGRKGHDEHPHVTGTETNDFVERYELQPIDRQTNGPQLFYGLRYHSHIVKPGEIETFHDQVGHWLWEPAASQVVFSLSIPRGQVLLAGGVVDADATQFDVRATLGSPVFGILSNPFLDRAFRTTSFVMRVTIHAEGTWSYDEETVLEVAGQSRPFVHRDRNTLTRVGSPQRNPLAM